MRTQKRLVRLQKRIFQSIRADVRRAIGPQRGDIKKYYSSYKREFQRSFKSSSREDLFRAISQSNIVLIGDYHCFSKAQKAAFEILEQIHQNMEGVKIALAMEMVQSEHQPAIDSYLSGKITEGQFLVEVDYEKTWGFPWQNFRGLMNYSKDNEIPVLGLNSPSTKLEARDDHAANLIVEWSRAHPDHILLVLYGDLHLARAHLPRQISRQLRATDTKRRVLTVFQNSESVYWKLANQDMGSRVDIVRLDRNRFCIMNAAPWIKLQSYLQWTENQRTDADEAGGEPTLYDIAHARLADLIAALGVTLPARPDFTLYSIDDAEKLYRMLSESGLSRNDLRFARYHLLANRTLYVPQLQSLYLGSSSLNTLAEGLAILVHASLSKQRRLLSNPEEDFHALTLCWTVGYFGSKLLNHKRKCGLEDDYRMELQHRLTKSALPQQKLQRKVARLVVSHCKAHKRFLATNTYRPPSLNDLNKVSQFVETTRALGGILGEHLFRAFLDNCFSQDELENLFLTNLGAADCSKLYLELVRITAKTSLGYSSKKEVF